MRKLILIIALLIFSGDIYSQVTSQGSTLNIYNTIVRRDVSGDIIISNAVAVDATALGTESLAQGDFTSHDKWSVTLDFDAAFSGGKAVYTWGGNRTSTLTQVETDLAIAGVDYRWYKFVYTVAVTTPFNGDGVATITTGFAETAKLLDLAAGTHSLLLIAKSASADFVISVVSGTDNVGTWSLDNLSLKEVTDGNIEAHGLFTGGGTKGLDINAAGMAEIGGWGYTGEHVIVSETSVNTNTGLGGYFQVDYAASSGKVFAGTYSRMLAIDADQTNQSTMVGMESQFRLRDVDIGDGVHAGLWAYAEQSGTSELSGNGTFDAISATVESGSDFTVGATEQITGITLDSSIDPGTSGKIDANANFSAVYVKSDGLDWYTGLKITGSTTGIDISGADSAIVIGENGTPGGDLRAWGTGAKSTYFMWDDDANSYGRLIINNASFRQYNLKSINETSMYVEMRQDESTDPTPTSNIAIWGAAKLDAGITNRSATSYAEATGIKGSYFIDGIMNGDNINVSGIKGEIHGSGTAPEVANIAAVSAKYNSAINPITGDNSLFWGWSHGGEVDYGLKLEATGSGSITKGIYLGGLGNYITGIDFDGITGGADVNYYSTDFNFTQGSINSGIYGSRGNITGVKTKITAIGDIDHVYALRSDAKMEMTATTETNQFYGAMVSASASGGETLTLHDGLVGLQATVTIDAGVTEVTGGLVAALFTNSAPIAKDVDSPTYNIYAKVGGYTDYGIAVQVESNNVTSGMRIQVTDSHTLPVGLEFSTNVGTMTTDIKGQNAETWHNATDGIWTTDGDINVDGGNIGITADANLMTLSSGVLTIDGDVVLSGTADNQIIFAIDDDAVTPSITLEPGTGFYASADNTLEIAIAAGKAWTFTNTEFVANYALGAKIMRESPSATNPIFTSNGDENSGYGKAHADQPSMIAGAKEVTRFSEGTDYVSSITGHNVAVLVTDATTNGTTTITKVGESFLTDVSVGDMVVIWGGLTQGTAYGNYLVVAVTDDDNLVVDRVVAAHAGVVNFDVLADGVVIENATDVTNHKARLRVPENLYVGGDAIVTGSISGGALSGVDLALSGDIYLDGTKKIIFDDDGDDHTYILESSNDVLDIYTGGTRALTIDGNQDVGIGIAPVTGVQLLLPQEDDATTPTSGYGDGSYGWYSPGTGELIFSSGATGRFKLTGNYMKGFVSASGVMINEVASATNPTLSPRENDIDTGIGSAGDDQLSHIAGIQEVTRMSEGNNFVSSITGHSVVKTTTNATTNGTTTINKSGAGFDDGSVSVGDAVVIYAGTTATDWGTYIIVSITDGSNIVVDRIVTGSDTNVDFDILADGVVIENFTDDTNHKARLRVPENLYVGGDIAVGGTVDGKDIATLLGATPGTATASVALVVDSNKDITLDGGDFTAANITATGAFTSLGIDDNATSNAITIEADEDVILVENLALVATKELLFDGGGGHTKIAETSSDVLSTSVGGVVAIRSTEINGDIINTSFGNIELRGTAITMYHMADATLQYGMVAMVDAGTAMRFDANDVDGDEPIGVVTGVGATSQGSYYGLAIIGMAHVVPAEDTAVLLGDICHSSSITAGYGGFDVAMTPAEDDEQVGHTARAEDITATINSSGGVNTGTEVITLGVNVEALGWVVGDPVVYWNSGGATLGGLTDGWVYWLLSVTTTEVTISATKGGSIVDLTDDGDEDSQYLQRLPLVHIQMN